MKALRLALFVIALFSTHTAHAAPLKKKDLSQRQIEAIQRHQAGVRQHGIMKKANPTNVPLRPFSEVETAGFLFFSANNDFNSEEVKHDIARNLPAGVTIVIYASKSHSKASILREYRDLVDPAQLKVIALKDSYKGFWARDGLPVPVWSTNGAMDLIDAKYYHGFEPDAEIAQKFSAGVTSHSYYFEGGNFMVNDQGDCLTVDNDLSAEIPDSLFAETYGCQRTIRFPFEKGIGHMDESIRFLGSKKVVTDSATYARTLESHGFEVVMLPRPKQQLETYVNALLINNTMYVPTFNQSTDQKALDLYRDAGFNVVGIDAESLANDGMGSIHCITMTYPKVPFNELLGKLGAKEL